VGILEAIISSSSTTLPHRYVVVKKKFLNLGGWIVFETGQREAGA
jgi:hypothetical protein